MNAIHINLEKLEAENKRLRAYAVLFRQALAEIEKLEAEVERLNGRLDKFRRATCANCGAGPSTQGKAQQ